MSPRPSISTLFPYTTLFRSQGGEVDALGVSRFRSEVRVALVQLRSRSAEKEQRHPLRPLGQMLQERDRKSTRLNSSHRCISYAVFCLKKKNDYSSVIANKKY